MQRNQTTDLFARICIGKDLANQSLFMDFAMLLWAFNINKPCDADGQEITPSRSEVIDEGLVVCVQLASSKL